MKNREYPIVIDSHVHIGIRPDWAFEGEDLIPRLDAESQDMAVVFPMMENFTHGKGPGSYNPFNGNDYIAQVQAEFPTRIIGLGSVNPWLQRNYEYGWKQGRSDKVARSPAIEEVERVFLELNLRGLKFHPLLQGFAFNDLLLMTPIFDKVEDCQRRINKRILVTVHSMADSSFDTPDAVATIAKRYPELAFALVHMGQVWGGFGLMNVVRDVPNLYLDATWVPNLALITAVVEQIGPRRVIAGTDAPWGSFRAKMVSIEEAVIDPDDRALVLGGNLADLFGIAPIEASGEVLGGVPREFEASGETP